MREQSGIKCVLLATLLLLNISESSGCQESQDLFANVTNTTCCTIALNAHQCPTWFVPRTQDGTITCVCGPEDANDIRLLKCDARNDQIKLLATACMTFNSSTNLTYIGWCPYSTHIWDKPTPNNPFFTALPNNISDLNDFMCGGLNRTGLLCSQCQDGLGPAVLSYKRECLECLDSRYGWLLYISLTMLPTTLLCIVIIIFRLDATSASMYSMILLCQAILNLINYYISSIPPLHHYQPKFIFMYIALTFYGFLNLDFFRYFIPPFCISNKMTTMQVIALDYTVALYPLILTAVVYYFIEFHDKGYRVFVWMWRPFRRFFIGFRKTWNLKGSVVNAFATFLLLSSSKFVVVSRDLLYGINPSNICGEKLLQKGYVSHYDTSMELFRSHHLTFAIPALLISIVFVIFPTTIFLFYQNKYFQKCLGCMRLRLTLLHELARISQSCYKDGTAGTWDCRWFAGILMCLRIYMLLILRTDTLWVIIGLVVCTLTISIFRPYKREVHNRANMLIFSTPIVTTIYIEHTIFVHYLPLWPVNVLVSLPFVYFILCAIHKLLQLISAYKRIMWAYRRLIQRFKTSARVEEEEVVPHRLLNPAEYPPFLPKTEHSVCDYTEFKQMN